MIIAVDLSAIPVSTVLVQPDDFTSLKVLVTGGEGPAAIDRDTFLALAGEAADGPWVDQLDAMLAFARSRGWVDERGAVTAHIEHAWAADPPGSVADPAG